MSEGLSIGNCGRNVGHSLCAWCWLLVGGRVHLPQSWCAGVHVCLLTNSKPDSAVNRRSQVWAEVSGRLGFVLV